MSDRFTFNSAGLVHELEMAMDRVGLWNSALVKNLCCGENLRIVREFLLGQISFKSVSEDATRFIIINETTIAVNLGVTPDLPFNGAEVVEHIGEGWVIVEKRPDDLYINGRKVVLHLSKRQKNGEWLKSHELREELIGKLVLNANVFDALYQNPRLIPEEWKKDENGNTSFIFFWGTIFRGSDGRLYVRCLYFHGGAWCWHCRWLGYDWDGHYPAALLAS